MTAIRAEMQLRQFLVFLLPLILLIHQNLERRAHLRAFICKEVSSPAKGDGKVRKIIAFRHTAQMLEPFQADLTQDLVIIDLGQLFAVFGERQIGKMISIGSEKRTIYDGKNMGPCTSSTTTAVCLGAMLME